MPTPVQSHPASLGTVRDSQYHARELYVLRQYAVTYLRELAALYPRAARELNEAAANYNTVVRVCAKISVVCSQAGASEFNPDEVLLVRTLIGAALKAERAAKESVEGALVLLDIVEEK